MARELLTERYPEQIAGVISCWDRVLIRGMLTTAGCPDGMTGYLSARGIRIFDFQEFAKPLTESVKAHAERLAAEAGLEINYIRKKDFRKEERIREVLAERGHHPGLVWVVSAWEPGNTYRPWRDHETGRCYPRLKDGKCLHYYFYFSDARLGLCYPRAPTWCPIRLRFYFNGHNWLASKRRQKGIAFEALANSLWRSRILRPRVRIRFPDSLPRLA